MWAFGFFLVAIHPISKKKGHGPGPIPSELLPEIELHLIKLSMWKAHASMFCLTRADEAGDQDLLDVPSGN